MRILLAANMARLKKDHLFWLSNLLMFAYGIYHVVSEYRLSITLQSTLGLDDMICGHTFIIGIVTAIFVSFFLGTEYGDGTIRNKLVIGCSRRSVYFANLLVSIAAVLSMCIFYMSAVLIVGIPLLGGLHTEVKNIAVLFMGSALLTAAFCSAYTMVSMCCGSKTATIAISITGSFVCFLAAAYIGSMLTLPGYWTGPQRAVLKFLYDFLPSGQAFQYMSTPVTSPYQKAVYNLLVIAITTLTGQIIFQRKNIK